MAKIYTSAMKIKFLFVFFTVCAVACKQKENYTEVRKTLENILEDDQKYRNPVYDWKKQNPIDRKNIKIVTKIIDSLGWLGAEKVGKNANLAFFVVIQHSHELSTMERYLPVMEEAAKKGNADKRQLAYLIDRIELLNNRKQIYGTQYSIRENGAFFIDNLIDSSQVDVRRKTMNLEPLNNYFKVLESAKN